MNYLELIDITLVFLGLMALSLGLVKTIKLIKQETMLDRQWILFSVFLSFFIIGYIIFGYKLFISQLTIQSVMVAAIFFGGGIFVFLVMTLFEKTIHKIEGARKLELINQKLQYIADRDDLTKVFKRRYFEESLKKSFYFSKTLGLKYGLLYIDINDFKSINDTFGHVVGDMVLVGLSDALIASFGSNDIVARLGGDEFVVLIEVKGRSEIENLANKLVTNIKTLNVDFEDKKVIPTVSIGITCVDKDAKSLDDVLMLADDACYRAKKKKALGGSHYVTRYVSDNH